MMLGEFMDIKMPTFNAGNVQATPTNNSSGGGGNIWTSLLNFGTKAVETVQKVAPVASDIKNKIDAIKQKTNAINQSINTNTSGGGGDSGSNEQPKGLSTGAKIAIGLSATGLLAGGIYLATRKNKK